MEKINVVLLNLTIDKAVSGVNRYLENLRRGLEIYPDVVVHEIVLLQKKEMLFYQIRQEEERVNATIMLPQNMNPVTSGLYWMGQYSAVVADILCPFFEHRERLVWHTHCLNLSQLAVLLKDRLGGCIATHLHCIPWKFAMENNPAKFKMLYEKYQDGCLREFNDSPVEEFAYRVSDRIICVTKAVRDYLAEVMQVPSGRLSLVYNGLADSGSSGRDEEGEDVLLVLYVGRISKEKGVPYLLQALEEIKRMGHPVRVTLAGSGNKAFVHELAKKYSELEPDFKGYVNTFQLIELYKQCTLGVIPSLHEQCSYVAMEMAMFGVPMVVSDVDGLGELFDDCKNALKVPLIYDREIGLKPDGNILAQAILRLAGEKGLRKSIGQAARSLFMECFTEERMVRETVEIYRSLL